MGVSKGFWFDFIVGGSFVFSSYVCRLGVYSLLYGQNLPHYHCLAGSWALLCSSHPNWVNAKSARLLARKRFGHKGITALSALYIFQDDIWCRITAVCFAAQSHDLTCRLYFLPLLSDRECTSSCFRV